MSRVMIFILSVICFFSCTSQPQPSVELTLPESFKASYDLKLPELDPDRFAPNQLYVEIEIQGQHYPFIIDTGDRYGTLRISERTLEKLDHQLLDDSRETKSLYGNHSEQSCLIKDITIGGYVIDEMVCQISEDDWFWPWNTAHEDMGMIGWGLLKEFNFSLDFSKGEVVFYHPEHIPDEVKTWQSVNYEEKKGMISVHGSFPDMKGDVSLLIDTGAGYYDFVNPDPHSNLLFPGSFRKLSRQTASKDDLIMIDFHSDGETITSLRFTEQRVPWFLSYANDGFLGKGFFWNHVVFFDNKNNKLYYD